MSVLTVLRSNLVFPTSQSWRNIYNSSRTLTNKRLRVRDNTQDYNYCSIRFTSHLLFDDASSPLLLWWSVWQDGCWWEQIYWKWMTAGTLLTLPRLGSERQSNADFISFSSPLHLIRAPCTSSSRRAADAGCWSERELVMPLSDERARLQRVSPGLNQILSVRRWRNSKLRQFTLNCGDCNFHTNFYIYINISWVDCPAIWENIDNRRCASSSLF